MEPALRASKRMALLAYLATARPRGYHRRDKLVALFWPDLTDERARAALRTTLGRLRADLGEDIFVTRGSTEIAVDTSRLASDVCLLDAALDDGRITDAEALYRGEFFDGVHVLGVEEELEHWISSERSRIRGALLDAMREYATRFEVAGDAAGALRLLRRARAIAPTDETVVRRIIRLLIDAGDRGTALAEFDALAQQLRREFQVAPSEETRALLQFEDPAPAPPALPAGRVTGRAMPASPQIPATTGAVTAPARPATTRVRLRWALGGAAVGLLVLLAATKAVLSARASGDQASEVAATWRSLSTHDADGPPRRIFEAAILDSTENGVVLVGGLGANGDESTPPIFDDIWRFSGLEPNETHRWIHLRPAPGPAPSPRWNTTAAYEAGHDRMLIFGGARGFSSPCTSETWVLEHASGIGAAPRWSLVEARGETPAPRAQAGGFFEPQSRRLVVFGGNDCVATYLNDLWMLTFEDSTLTVGRWTRLVPDSNAGMPSRHNGVAVAYDPRSKRLFAHGGTDRAGTYTDLWRLDHADATDGVPAWQPMHCAGTAPALHSHIATYDAATSTLLVFGGIDAANQARNDVWRVTGLADDGTHCAWEHVATLDVAPNRRDTPRGFLSRHGESLIVLGGAINGVAFMDMWRLDRPFGR